MKALVIGSILGLALISSAFADTDYAAQERNIIAAFLKAMTCKEYKPGGKYCFTEYKGTKLEFRAMKDIAVNALGAGVSVTPVSRKCLDLCFGDLTCVIVNGNGTLTSNFDNPASHIGCD